MSELQLCTFQVGDLMFGVDVMEVQEVLRAQAMTPVPLSAPSVAGLINLRGQIVTAVDLRTLLGLPARPFGVQENVVVFAEDEATSLLVDRVEDVVTVDPEQFERIPDSVSAPLRTLTRGVYKHGGALLLALRTTEAARADAP